MQGNRDYAIAYLEHIDKGGNNQATDDTILAKNQYFIRDLIGILVFDEDNNEIKDERINFVTVTATSITNDLSHAKVYITLMNDENKEEVLKVLNNARGFIEKELCKRVEIRKMPELKFVYDDSIEYSNNIENIIESINKNV